MTSGIGPQVVRVRIRVRIRVRVRVRVSGGNLGHRPPSGDTS